MLKTLLASTVAIAAAQGPSGTCGKEECASECKTVMFPDVPDLPVNAFLPDPFAFADKSRAASLADMACVRWQALQLTEHYELGEKPPAPAVVEGTVTSTLISVTAGNASNSITFTAAVQLPTTGQAPYPALIAIGGSSINTAAIRALGVAVITFKNDEMAQQSSAASRGKGKFYDLYGQDHPAGALTAWAWGVSRIIDVIEASPGVINPMRIAVTGCSRNGKGALVVGALDERIALTIPQESGRGGSASWRISDWQGPTVQTIEEITGENVWFASILDDFNHAGGSPTLPTDHHQLMGAVAPRGLLVIDNTQMVWLGNQSCWGSSVAGHMVYEAMGVPDHMGVTQQAHPDHCNMPASQGPFVLAFVQKFLLDASATNTTLLETDGGYVFDQAKWVNWTIPQLK